MTIRTWLHSWGSLARSYERFGLMAPWFLGIGAFIWLISLGLGLWWVPKDYQQGDAFRIIYVHVPAAFYSMGLYLALAVFSAIFLIWRIKLAALMARACAGIGAWITVLALLTGAIWGKPMWGAWWVWDARLTSELILLFLFWGVLALQNSLPNPSLAQKASALLAIVGALDLPIIHYSVQWWYTLHQGATLSRLKPTMAPIMLYPLLGALAGFALLLAGLLLLRTRTFILSQAEGQLWVQTLLKGGNHA